jgi:hypothetical protein
MKLAFLPRTLFRRVLVVALVLVAGASIVAGRERPAPEALEARPARSEPAAAAPEIDLAKLERREAEAPQGDPFAPRNFAAVRQAAAPRTAAPAAETPKGPPPLPFTYAGWMTQDGKTEIFVARGDELISIEVGQKIEQYRVDSISDERIAFTYLPMKKRQSLERVEESKG